MRIIRETTYDFVGPCKAEDCKRHILTNIDLIWSFYNFICKRSLCSELEIILIIFLFTVTVFKWKNMISAIIEALAMCLIFVRSNVCSCEKKAWNNSGFFAPKCDNLLYYQLSLSVSK